jgi:hypothetical protein
LEPIDIGRSIILDLKLPTEKIVLNKKNRDRFYATIFEYVAQLKEYGRFFDSYSNRRWFRNKYGFEPFEPDLVLVIGKDYTNVDYDTLKRLRTDVNPVHLMTYTELLDLHCKPSNHAVRRSGDNPKSE